MHAQWKAQLADSVDHPLVQVDHERTLVRGLGGGQLLDELLLGATAALPGSWISQLIRPTLDSIFGTKPNDNRISGRWSVFAAKSRRNPTIASE